jgi:hypothetical protein
VVSPLLVDMIDQKIEHTIYMIVTMRDNLAKRPFFYEMNFTLEIFLCIKHYR